MEGEYFNATTIAHNKVGQFKLRRCQKKRKDFERVFWEIKLYDFSVNVGF